MEKYTFCNASIDAASEFVAAFLKKEKVASKDILRTRLMMEEALLNYRDVLGEDASFSMICASRFGKLRIEIRVRGISYNPLTIEDSSDNDILKGVLAGAGIIPAWQYKNGQNILVFSPRKEKTSPMVWIAAAAVAAMISGGMLSGTSVGQAISAGFITPVFDSLIGLMMALSSFVIFLSLVWGIISIGDLAVFEKIGKKMIIRLLFMCGGLLTAFGLLVLPLFPLSLEGSANLQLSALFQMFLDIIPTNLIAPFWEGKPLQVIFLAVVFGIALLILGTKASSITLFVEQANNVFNVIMEGVGAFVPLLIFVSLFDMMVKGNVVSMPGTWKMLLLALAGILFAMLVYFLLCLRKGIRPAVLVKKLFPTFVIAFSTASSTAALSTNLETCDNKLGIKPSFTRFAVPLYQVIFMPATALEFFAILLSACEMYGISISPLMLIMAVISILLLSIATPPVPGSGAAVLMILFAQFGIPPEAIGIAASIDIVLEFIITAGEVFCQQSELILLSDSLGMLDREVLCENR